MIVQTYVVCLLQYHSADEMTIPRRMLCKNVDKCLMCLKKLHNTLIDYRFRC